MSKILQNQARCNKCLDEPYSAYRHDFKTCKCGALSVDGGLAYLRRVGEIGNHTDLSITMDEEVVKTCKSEIEAAIASKSNALGILCAVMRILRDNGYEVKEPSEDINK